MTLAGMAPNPEVEVPDKARRRRFTAEYKREILKRADACTEPGARQSGRLLFQRIEPRP
jgi:hypothetical protein